MTDLATAAKEIEEATSYYEVFGPCEYDDYFALMNHVKHVYHRYAKVLHPDLYTDGFEQLTAQVWFVRRSATRESVT